MQGIEADRIKKSSGGAVLLNLGCGPRTHRDWNNMDFSPYARLAANPLLSRFLHFSGLLSKQRYQNVLNVDPDIIHRDVHHGLGLPDAMFDAVYHSHFITHLDRDVALMATRECRRILKPGGVLRVVVPDLEHIVRQYSEAVAALDGGETDAVKMHRHAVDELFELMVRRQAVGMGGQSPLVRVLEGVVRGGVERTGERRLWHYDRFSMAQMMRQCGFEQTFVLGPDESRIAGWSDYHLDRNSDGSLHKPDSLFMEAV